MDEIVGAIHESPEQQLTACGRIVDGVIQNLPDHLHVTIDQYEIMPNHVHLIAVITEEDVLRAIRESPLRSNRCARRRVSERNWRSRLLVRR